jgi:predicted dehydrogenase
MARPVKDCMPEAENRQRLAKIEENSRRFLRGDLMVAQRRIGYALVGLGGIAQRAVLPAFRHSKKAKLVALVSRDRNKARRLARKFSAATSYTYDEFDLCLNQPDVHAVYLASPNGCHAEQTLRAAAAGKHVLCEKPMANTVEQCRAMLEACRAQNVRLMIAYRKYFEPASRALKKLVDDGKLGRLKVMHSAFTIYLPPGKEEGWRFDPQLAGGGALPDLGIYCINTARWIASKDPSAVTARCWTVDPKRFSEVIEENTAFQLAFPGGLLLQATASFGAAQASFFQVHGERGWAALNPAFAYDEERRLFGKLKGRWFHQVFPTMDEFALELDAFADCIQRDYDPEPSALEGLRDVAVLEAIYQAAREHREVPFVKP